MSRGKCGLRRRRTMDCGGNRSATALWLGLQNGYRTKSVVALRLPPQSILLPRHILGGQEDRLDAVAFFEEAAGVEPDFARAQPRQLDLDLIINDAFVPGKNVLEQQPKIRGIKGAATDLKKRFGLDFLERKTEGVQEPLVHVAHDHVGPQDQQWLFDHAEGDVQRA